MSNMFVKNYYSAKAEFEDALQPMTNEALDEIYSDLKPKNKHQALEAVSFIKKACEAWALTKYNTEVKNHDE